MKQIKQSKNIFVLLPTFNEEQSIKKIIKSIRYPFIIIDDCSSDNTKKTAESLGATVIGHKTNLGTGYAIKTGFNHIVSHNNYVITMDADGQHDPSYIPHLLHHITQSSCDVVIASRYIKKTNPSTSKLRIIGTKIISLWLYLWFGKRIYDPTSGFRIYNKRTVEFLADRYPTKFPEPESIILLLQHGFTIQEISVPMKKRLHGSSSISFKKAIELFFYIIFIIPILRLRHRMKSVKKI